MTATAPLDLAFVIDNLGSGGAQRQAVELAVRLRAEAGVRTRIAVYRPVDTRDRDLHGERLAAAGVPVDLVAKRSKLDPSLPARLGAVLAGRDVVHSFMPTPTLWAWLALRTQPARRRPVLIAAERCMPSQNPLRDRLLTALVYRRADAVTANARPALEELARVQRIPRARLHYLPNGIDLEAWDRAAALDPPWELEPGFFHLALIGRISAQKNQELLLEALTRLPPELLQRCRAWLVGADTGDAAISQRIRARIRESRLEQIVRLAPPTERVAALLARLDVLVLPSRFEGFPNVVLEAMAVGPLVVATPVGDVPSLVEDGRTGLLFRSEDAADLARALQAAHALGAEGRRALAARARRHVEQSYRVDVVARAHLELYQRVRRPPAPGTAEDAAGGDPAAGVRSGAAARSRSRTPP